jgi:hypothetical protein
MQDKFWNIVETWGAIIVAAGTFAGVIIHGALTHGWTWL